MEKHLSDVLTQKPDLVAAEGKIAHARRKLAKDEALRETVSKDARKQEERLASLRNDLEEAQKAAEVARGEDGFWTSPLPFS